MHKIKSYSEFILESKTITSLPTKISGSKFDFVINKLGNDYEVIDADGNFVLIKEKSIIKALDKIFSADSMSFEEYLENNDHAKYYKGKDDWDSDFVILNGKIEDVLEQINKLF